MDTIFNLFLFLDNIIFFKLKHVHAPASPIQKKIKFTLIWHILYNVAGMFEKW